MVWLVALVISQDPGSLSLILAQCYQQQQQQERGHNILYGLGSHHVCKGKCFCWESKVLASKNDTVVQLSRGLLIRSRRPVIRSGLAPGLTCKSISKQDGDPMNSGLTKLYFDLNRFSKSKKMFAQ